MKLRLLAVGSVSNKNLLALCSDYEARIKHLTPFEILEIRDGKAKEGERRLRDEAGELRLKAGVKAEGSLLDWVLWDEQGKDLSSESFSGWLEKKAHTGAKQITFVIGSSHGIDLELKKAIPLHLRLSHFTLTHEMARMLALEQLYRAHCILRHLPYHH